MAKPLTKSRTLGHGQSKLVQLYMSDDLKALIDVVVMRQGGSLSGYMRRAVWERLQRDATSEEMKAYKATAWRKSA